jgi:hypothetical protein
MIRVLQGSAVLSTVLWTFETEVQSTCTALYPGTVTVRGRPVLNTTINVNRALRGSRYNTDGSTVAKTLGEPQSCHSTVTVTAPW